MVLAELGGSIVTAIKKLHSTAIFDEKVLDEVLKDIATALMLADVNIKYVSELRDNVKKELRVHTAVGGANKKRVVQKAVVNELIRVISPAKAPVRLKKGRPNVVMFVGLQGSGKTTTCAKYAHYHQRRGWKSALVCADTFRAGAFDQMKQNATKTKVPFFGSYTEANPVNIAKQGVDTFRRDDFDLIIVDTSGRHKQELALFDEMKQVTDAIQPDLVVFTMDSHIGQACFDQAAAFQTVVDVGAVIVTKLDGHARGGGALSAVAATNSPIIFLGTGEHFDEFEPFEPKGFISRLLGMGDINGLFSTIGEAVELDKQPALLNRISTGVFTMRDMREQFESVLRMGSISKLMSMIPGLGNKVTIPKGKEQETTERLQKFMHMMDSMHGSELDGTKALNDERIERVARGSGTLLWEVRLLQDQYKSFSKMVTKMGKMGLAKGGGTALANQMMRNPTQVRNKLHKVMGQRAGGANMMHLMNQMKEMGGFDPSLFDGP